jgi:hypothetical protein
MTIAETTRIDRPAMPSTKPAKVVDLTKPGPTGADLPTVDAFFADLNLGIDTIAQLRRSLPDTLVWAQQIERARAASDEERAKLPTVKQVLGWINALRTIDMGNGEAAGKVPYGFYWRTIWSAYRGARGLSFEQMRESFTHEPTNAFALRMAEYTVQSVTTWLAIREAQRAAKAAKAGMVAKAIAELRSAPFVDAPSRLEVLAENLAAAGRTDEAREVRLVGLGVVKALLERDTFHRLAGRRE